MFRASTLATTLALTACSLPRPADVLPPDAAVSPDAAPDPNTVTGTSIVRYYTETGMTTAPEDLARYTIQAYVPDATATGGFRIVDAAITGPGTFTIPTIPPGTGYYLKLTPVGSSTPTFYWTDARSLDLGYPTSGRPTWPTRLREHNSRSARAT